MQNDVTARRMRPGYLLCLLLIVSLQSCQPQQSDHAAIPSPSPTKQVTASATPTARPLPDAAQIEAYLTGLATRGSLVGSVLVAHNGMVFSQGYGPADRDAQIPNTVNTIFRIGSNSKQFTAMAILILQDQGRLHVQDHLCLYIANCPADWRPITLYQLLIHASGIPDYTNMPGFVATWNQPTTPDQLITRFKNAPLEFTPGSRWSYSNSGYILLGYVIEQVSGESYATFLRERIFQPLGMQNTGYDVSRPQLPQHATGYYQGYIKPDFYDISVFDAAGAIASTVADLYIWDQALEKQRLVSPGALDAMFTPQIPCPNHRCLLSTDVGYGFGWFIAKEPNGKLIYHLGRVDGFFTFNGFYPDSDLDVVVLSNLEGTDALGIARTLANMVMHS